MLANLPTPNQQQPTFHFYFLATKSFFQHFDKALKMFLEKLNSVLWAMLSSNMDPKKKQ